MTECTQRADQIYWNPYSRYAVDCREALL